MRLVLKLLTIVVLLFLVAVWLMWGPARTELDLHFNRAPVVTPFFDQYWMLNEDLVFQMKRREEPLMEVEIVVPAGFVSDLASIPIPANIIFSKTGRYAAAGIVHDYLYWVQPCERREAADRIIKEALKAADRIEEEVAAEKGNSLSRAYIFRRKLARNTIKHAVYIGGRYSWGNNKEGRKEHVRSVKKQYRDTIVPGESWEDFESKYGEKLKYVIKQDVAKNRGQKIEEPDYCNIFQDEW